VRFDDLQFNSGFEKEAFTGFQSGSPDYLKLFLAVSPKTDLVLYERIRQKISDESDRINVKNFSKKPDEKKVKFVYELVNKEILTTYKEQILFPDIFSTGYFNCLTASAYYGFIFSNLGIDFEFKETMNHVHPVAFPGSLQIKVETTDPINGFQYFDNKLKLQFVSYLINSKTISKEDAQDIPLDSIFNKYYFPESSIGMKELAGLQYLNDAFFKYGNGDFESAFKQIQKAYFLYSDKRVSTLMLFLLSECINKQDYKEVEDISFLAFASRFVGEDLDLKIFLSEFISITQEVLIEKSQPKLYDQMFDYMTVKIDPGEVLNTIITEYHFQKGRILMTTFRVKEALSHFEKALELQPDNLDLQTLTVQSLGYSFSTTSNQEIVSNAEEFEKKFPLMKSNESFVSLQMTAYLQYGEEKFDFEMPVDGEVLLKKFEDLFHSHPGISIQYEKVGDAYSSAAVYYFKRNNKSAARSWLNRGLEISPENYQLMYRIRALE
jgi:tetratricopeptide (TPR) repeat protein